MEFLSTQSSIISDFGLIFVQLSAVFAILAYYWIHYKKRPILHGICMGLGVGLLWLFLIFYITNYALNGVKTFGGPSDLALFFYYPFLIIHIFGATITGFLTTYQAIGGFRRFDNKEENEWSKFKFDKAYRSRHRTLGKYGLILWMFTAVSGLMVFIMLYILYTPIRLI